MTFAQVVSRIAELRAELDRLPADARDERCLVADRLADLEELGARVMSGETLDLGGISTPRA